mgnify:CR=1 FL=1
MEDRDSTAFRLRLSVLVLIITFVVLYYYYVYVTRFFVLYIFSLKDCCSRSGASPSITLEAAWRFTEFSRDSQAYERRSVSANRQISKDGG